MDFVSIFASQFRKMNLLLNRITKAAIADLPMVMETFMACTAELKKHGINQWNYQYPEPTEVLNDIKDGTVFIIKNSKRVVACITLNTKQDIQYKKVDWVHKDAKVMVMHRLAVHPASQGLGFAKKMCQFAEEHALKNGFNCIRLDAFSDNPSSNSLYLSLGYEIASGICYYHDVKKPFYCYEKELTGKISKY